MTQHIAQTLQQRLDNRVNTSYANAVGLNPSFAATNKWICYLPFKMVLGDAYPNLELQCTQFYLPQVDVNTSTVSYRGYSIRVPASGLMNAGDKTAKFQYIIDDDWRNYTCLYTWASKFAEMGDAVDPNSNVAQLAGLAKFFATVRVWLLDSFKRRIVDFVFEDCWIFNFSDLLLDCASSEPIKHSFSLSYSRFKIQDIISTSGNKAADNPDFT